ncbi:hypothetical protein PPYR_01814 [Photinus pyralis]|uniref:RecA family profile 1 domain-containing protein n=1 Tax=Photinus pyralis TaxID=7054 RepID=A0A1Y1KKZ4_PHOPY|nr:DNA repair protein XRCC3 [Photinus pyralis]KAB0804844.1 hypothetical protein PPYR_01814 [Photinus pyralis]
METLPENIYKKIHDSKLKSTSILLHSDIYLEQALDLSPEEVTRLRRSMLRREFISARDIPAWPRLTTGCPSIDSVTSGGIPINGLTEIAGPSGVGKTQLCLQLAITVQLPAGLGKGAIYICTEDLFPSKRLHQLAACFSDHKVMDNVFVEHISDYEQLRRCCQIRIPMLLLKRPIGLVVIDSIAGVFRSDSATVDYSQRSREFSTIVTSLNKLCLQYGIAVVVTNQVGDNSMKGRSEPCLGLAWSNLVTCRFWISRELEGVRNFEVVFAPDLPNKTAQFVIISSGVKDAG